MSGIAGDRLRVPLVVHRDYGLPACVRTPGDRGQPLWRDGRDRPARRRDAGACHWSSSAPAGAGAAATADGTPYLRYESPGQPRAAIGFGLGLLHELLSRAGLLADPDPLGPAVETLEALLERNAPSVETDASPAKQLAWSIFGRIPIIYGAGRMTSVAHRWKTQMNENAKAWAAFEPMPEANHNAIEGSLNPRELSDALYVVELRDPTEAPEVAAATRSSTSCSASGPPTAAWCGRRGRHRWRECSQASRLATW